MAKKLKASPRTNQSLTYYCRACEAEGHDALDDCVASRRPLWTPSLWRAGWTAVASGYPKGHFWLCPACATTLKETRVVLALLGVPPGHQLLWHFPLRYRIEHALWIVRRWWRMLWRR